MLRVDFKNNDKLSTLSAISDSAAQQRGKAEKFAKKRVSTYADE